MAECQNYRKDLDSEANAEEIAVPECQNYREDLDSEANAVEIATSIFQADAESGTLQQVGFRTSTTLMISE